MIERELTESRYLKTRQLQCGSTGITVTFQWEPLGCFLEAVLLFLLLGDSHTQEKLRSDKFQVFLLAVWKEKDFSYCRSAE